MMVKVPVSIKAIIRNENDEILIVKNEREQWELPGGRIEIGETPVETVVREVKEELNLECYVGNIVDSWMFEVIPERYVFIVTYECFVDHMEDLVLSDEHQDFRWASIDDLNRISIPDGYKRSIRKVMDI